MLGPTMRVTLNNTELIATAAERSSRRTSEVMIDWRAGWLKPVKTPRTTVSASSVSIDRSPANDSAAVTTA